MNITASYQFGRIIISNKKHSTDVIIFPDRVRDNWRRKERHQLYLEDIVEVMTENPKALVASTGAPGLMRILPEVTQAAGVRGIELITEPTTEIYDTYNQLHYSQRVVATPHLTC